MVYKILSRKFNNMQYPVIRKVKKCVPHLEIYFNELSEIVSTVSELFCVIYVNAMHSLSYRQYAALHLGHLY